jgi:uncharacterized surface protein with fasciclin (FAS1) repeats
MASFSAKLSKMLVLLSLIFSLASAKLHGGFRGVGLETETPTESPIQIAIEPDVTIEPVSMTDVGTITDIAVGDSDLATLAMLLTMSGVADALAVDGPFTVFAPTNAAFTNVDLFGLGIDTIAEVLTYHAVEGSYMASDITDGLILETLQGETIEFGIDGGVVTVNEEVISVTDIPASNGFIHIIDGVMFPKAILVESDGTTPDESSESSPSTIVDIASADPDLGVLVGLLIYTDLDETLSSEGPFTVFAPTDISFISTLDQEAEDPSITGDTDPNEISDVLSFISALDKVGAGGAVGLYNPNLLKEVLTYHVVSDTYLASDITDGLTLPTVNGETILFNITDDGVTVNGKAVVFADISASNGVIHKIDGVLVPSME